MQTSPPETPEKKRPGRKPGTRFNIIPREPGDEMARRAFWLLDSEFDMLERYGGGGKRAASKGLRAILKMVRELEKARER